jgi:hypothetical protein
MAEEVLVDKVPTFDFVTRHDDGRRNGCVLPILSAGLYGNVYAKRKGKKVVVVSLPA